MFTRLSEEQVEAAHHYGTGRAKVVDAQVVEMLQSLEIGDGGVFELEELGIKKDTAKRILRNCAEVAGVFVEPLRSNSATLVFQVVAEQPVPRTRARLAQATVVTA